MINFGTKKTHPNVNWRPWDYTSGPISVKGKFIASRNSYRHGYYSEVFCEFRKNKRRSETIQFEWKCLRLIRAVDSSSFDLLNIIIGDLSNFFWRIWEGLRDKQLNSGLMLELKYITTLYERIIRYSLSIILKNLNIHIREQNGN
jgi:hypothetical protein